MSTAEAQKWELVSWSRGLSPLSTAEVYALIMWRIHPQNQSKPARDKWSWVPISNGGEPETWAAAYDPLNQSNRFYFSLWCVANETKW